MEVIALAGSQIKFAAIDRIGKHLDTYLNRRGYLGNDATIDWAIGLLNEGNVVADLDSELKGTAVMPTSKLSAFHLVVRYKVWIRA